ncbi:MAG TPA: DMT family transporter [Mobilitalea sp.]|nr:DMT family transporter [Mobilitalea sp.]
MKSKGYMILAMLTFGSIGLFIREIPLPSAQTALARGVIGGLFLMLYVVISKKSISYAAIKKNWLILMASGACIGFNWILLFEAYKYTTISNATLSYYFAPVIVVFLSPAILKERLSKLQVICILGAMAGMFLIAGNGSGGGLDQRGLIGIGFGLSAAVFYAAVIIMNKFMKNQTALETTLVQLAIASLVLIPYVLLQGKLAYQELSGKELLLLIVVGLLHTGIAYLLYFTAMYRMRSQTVAVFSYIDPISAVVMSALFLGEVMRGPQILGGVLILAAAFYSGRTKE